MEIIFLTLLLLFKSFKVFNLYNCYQCMCSYINVLPNKQNVLNDIIIDYKKG